MPTTLETAISAEPKEPEITFICEGSNFKCKIKYQSIYDDSCFKQEDILNDIAGRCLNYVFFNSSNETLELEMLDGTDKPLLGVVLFIYVKNPDKGTIINTSKILFNYCSRPQLALKYQKLLEEIISKEED